MKVRVGFILWFFLISSLSWAGEVSERAQAVALSFMKRRPAKTLDWEWRDAIFLHGLAHLARSFPKEQEARSRMVAYLKEYHDYWAQRGIPRVNRSDLCPSALSGLVLAREEGWSGGLEAARAVGAYLAELKPNRLGTLDHLGTSWLRFLYPASIWVDSLMMYAVFAAQWANFQSDEPALRFAVEQPLRFALALQDRDTGLLRHAYLHGWKIQIPRERAFWLRGNGWALASIVEILDEIEGNSAFNPERARLIRLLGEISDGLARRMNPNGSWGAILAEGVEAEPETSGTALVAAAWYHAVRRGWLPAEPTRRLADRAFGWVESQIQDNPEGEPILHGTSGPTNAFPLWFYLRVSHEPDLAYGVGAYLLAASQRSRLK